VDLTTTSLHVFGILALAAALIVVTPTLDAARRLVRLLAGIALLSVWALYAISASSLIADVWYSWRVFEGVLHLDLFVLETENLWRIVVVYAAFGPLFWLTLLWLTASQFHVARTAVALLVARVVYALLVVALGVAMWEYWSYSGSRGLNQFVLDTWWLIVVVFATFGLLLWLTRPRLRFHEGLPGTPASRALVKRPP
jgi:hypothetical protein